MLTTRCDRTTTSAAVLVKGRVLETILNTEQGVASRGGDSQSPPREVRKAAAGHYDPVRGARCDRSGRKSGEGKRGTGAKNRHGGAPGGERPPRDARRLARCLACRRVQAQRVPRKHPYDSRRSAHPFNGVREAKKQNPGAKNAPREGRGVAWCERFQLVIPAEPR